MVKRLSSTASRRLHSKKYLHGDTLVEVMLAIGIFSMVAVSVVAIMNSGTNSSQFALEVSLASQEVSNQKEALDFIGTAYMNDYSKSENESLYTALYKRLDSLSSNISGNLNHPSSCQDLYQNGVIDNAFIIDINKLANYESLLVDPSDPERKPSAGELESLAQEIIVQNPLGNTTKKLQPTLTYPRLLYTSGGINDSNVSLSDSSTSFTGNNVNLYAAEGIYIIAKKSDPKIIKPTNGNPSRVELGVDCYIYTCWYSPGDQTPSVISDSTYISDPVTTRRESNKSSST